MAVLSTEELNRRIRLALHETDITVKLQICADMVAQSIGSSQGDITNINNAIATEIARRKALSARDRNSGV